MNATNFRSMSPRQQLRLSKSSKISIGGCEYSRHLKVFSGLNSEIGQV